MPPPHVSLQDSSSGNASDMESQEGGGGHKFKGKEGSRQPASNKAAAGYKVEDKSTWTLDQQQQQYCSPLLLFLLLLTYFIHPPPPPPTFFTFSDFYVLSAL